MHADSKIGTPANIVFSPTSGRSSARPAEPAASRSGAPRSEELPPINAALAHVLAMSRAALARLPKVPAVSVDEASFVDSRRSCQE
jgi:hypothetical protein